MVSLRPSIFVLALCLTLGLTSACNSGPAEDPFKTAVASYKNAVEPPLQKSEEIGKVFMQIVLDDQGAPNPDKAAERIKNEVVPKAQEFVDAVQAIQVKEQALVELHQYLQQTAQLRLEGYQAIADGYTQKNLELFTQGQKKVTDSKIQEENFVARADQVMRSQGYTLTYFAPAMSAAPAPSGAPAAPAAPAQP